MLFHWYIDHLHYLHFRLHRFNGILCRLTAIFASEELLSHSIVMELFNFTIAIPSFSDVILLVFFLSINLEVAFNFLYEEEDLILKLILNFQSSSL